MGKFKPEFDIPKNVKLTEEYVEQNREEVTGMMEYFLNYPDVFLDMITPAYSNLEQQFYKRI